MKMCSRFSLRNLEIDMTNWESVEERKSLKKQGHNIRENQKSKKSEPKPLLSAMKVYSPFSLRNLEIDMTNWESVDTRKRHNIQGSSGSSNGNKNLHILRRHEERDQKRSVIKSKSNATEPVNINSPKKSRGANQNTGSSSEESEDVPLQITRGLSKKRGSSPDKSEDFLMRKSRNVSQKRGRTCEEIPEREQILSGGRNVKKIENKPCSMATRKYRRIVIVESDLSEDSSEDVNQTNAEKRLRNTEIKHPCIKGNRRKDLGEVVDATDHSEDSTETFVDEAQLTQVKQCKVILQRLKILSDPRCSFSSSSIKSLKHHPGSDTRKYNSSEDKQEDSSNKSMFLGKASISDQMTAGPRSGEPVGRINTDKEAGLDRRMNTVWDKVTVKEKSKDNRPRGVSANTSAYRLMPTRFGNSSRDSESDSAVGLPRTRSGGLNFDENVLQLENKGKKKGEFDKNMWVEKASSDCESDGGCQEEIDLCGTEPVVNAMTVCNYNEVVDFIMSDSDSFYTCPSQSPPLTQPTTGVHTLRRFLGLFTEENMSILTKHEQAILARILRKLIRVHPRRRNFASAPAAELELGEVATEGRILGGTVNEALSLELERAGEGSLLNRMIAMLGPNWVSGETSRESLRDDEIRNLDAFKKDSVFFPAKK